ncbi:MAG: group II intron reverse transcriptase/maturase [Paludibacteraceae bacterium]|nr:group II intron reverse transcriptase/maturase [Paludibacteraceae bacterium]MBQ5477357.1 group II intron reverse transcriptase/maturase [Bacteroidaceae bacterium]
MKEEMQKTRTDYRADVGAESRDMHGVQTFMGIVENNLVEVTNVKSDLLTQILSPSNMNLAYQRVVRNGGSGGIDSMETKDLLPYLRSHKEELVQKLTDGKYRPNPVRRVEIPKDNGKKRPLGIPTVVDRLVQQSIAQILQPLYEPQFSPNSFGFRPNRGAHQALRCAQSIINDGNRFCIDLDLEQFFDNVNHSKLIEVIGRTVKDGRVVSLIHKYLNAGVLVAGKYAETKKGVPQGGPLSPLLSNIMLNELDKELTKRGHPFVRYADDCMIFCKSERAAGRILESITKFIEGKLFLKVNRDKTSTGSVSGKKFLGYSFYFDKDGCQLCLHSKTVTKLKARLKTLTGRSNGLGYAQRKEALALFIRGWVEYYKLARMKTILLSIDHWLRRRIRMCIWKSWKKPRTRIANLIKCGIPARQAYKHGWMRGYWHASQMWTTCQAMSNSKLYRAGYRCLMDYYVQLS